MALAVITKTFPIIYDKYLKFFLIKFRVKCPHCKRIMKHCKYSLEPFTIPTMIMGEKECIKCFKNYSIVHLFY